MNRLKSLLAIILAVSFQGAGAYFDTATMPLTDATTADTSIDEQGKSPKATNSFDVISDLFSTTLKKAWKSTETSVPVSGKLTFGPGAVGLPVNATNCQGGWTFPGTSVYKFAVSIPSISSIGGISQLKLVGTSGNSISVSNPCQYATSSSGTGSCETGLNVFEFDDYSSYVTATTTGDICVSSLELDVLATPGTDISNARPAVGPILVKPFSTYLVAKGNGTDPFSTIPSAYSFSFPTDGILFQKSATAVPFDLSRFKNPDGKLAGKLVMSVYFSSVPDFSGGKHFKVELGDGSGIRKFVWKIDGTTKLSDIVVGWNTFAFPFDAASFSSSDGSTIYDFAYSHAWITSVSESVPWIFTDFDGHAKPATIAIDDIRYSDAIKTPLTYIRAFNDKDVVAYGNGSIYVTRDNSTWGKVGEIAASSDFPVGFIKLRGAEIYGLINKSGGWSSAYSLDKMNNYTEYDSGSGESMAGFDMYDYGYGFSVTSSGWLYKMFLQEN